MSRRSIGLASAFLVIAVVSAACGGSSATPAPAVGATPTPGVAGAVPSGHPDNDLAALFPKTVAGAPLTVTTRTGQDFAASSGQGDETAQAQEKQLTDFVASQGKSISDFSIGFGGGRTPEGETYIVEAFRLKGGDANAVETALLPLLAAGGPAPQTSQVQVGGRTMSKVLGLAAVGGQDAYLYPKNDVVWLVSATDPILTEIANQLT